jgi:hypothetical protein
LDSTRGWTESSFAEVAMKTLPLLLSLLLCGYSFAIGLAQTEIVECYRYEIRELSNRNQKAGDAFYEVGGSRFVYQYKMPNDEFFNLPVKMACGFDGNEYWIAAYWDGMHPWMDLEHATAIARFKSKSALSNRFSESDQVEFGFDSGKKCFDKLALVEYVKNRCHMSTAQVKFKAALLDCVKTNEKLVEIKSAYECKHARFLGQNATEPNVLMIEGFEDSTEKASWHFFAHFDDDANHPVLRAFVVDEKQDKQQPAGGIYPFSRPLLPWLGIRREEKREVSQLVFLPQYYSNGGTKLIDISKKEK